MYIVENLTITPGETASARQQREAFVSSRADLDAFTLLVDALGFSHEAVRAELDARFTLTGTSAHLIF